MPLNEYDIFYADPSSEMSLHNISAAQATSISIAVNKIKTLEDILYFTSSVYFDRKTYPNAKAFRVKCLGGGGGGGGAALTAVSQVAIGLGGAGGFYAESLLTNIDEMPEIIPITVGAGGTAGAAGNNAGGTGGTSSFGNYVIALGGTGGAGGAAVTITDYDGGTFNNTTTRGLGTGNFVIPGGASVERRVVGYVNVMASRGGESYYAKQQRTYNVTGVGFSPDTLEPVYVFRPGLGGTGGANPQSRATTVPGGAGGIGSVIVEVYS